MTGEVRSNSNSVGPRSASFAAGGPFDLPTSLELPPSTPDALAVGAPGNLYVGLGYVAKRAIVGIQQTTGEDQETKKDRAE